MQIKKKSEQKRWKGLLCGFSDFNPYCRAYYLPNICGIADEIRKFQKKPNSKNRIDEDTSIEDSSLSNSSLNSKEDSSVEQQDMQQQITLMKRQKLHWGYYPLSCILFAELTLLWYWNSRNWVIFVDQKSSWLCSADLEMKLLLWNEYLQLSWHYLWLLFSIFLLMRHLKTHARHESIALIIF